MKKEELKEKVNEIKESYENLLELQISKGKYSKEWLKEYDRFDNLSIEFENSILDSMNDIDRELFNTSVELLNLMRDVVKK